MQFKKRLSKKFDKDIARISTKLKEKNNNGISTFFFAISQYKVLNNNYATPPGNIYVVQSVARLILAPAPVTYFCFPFRGFKKSSCQYGRAIGPNIFDFSLVFSGSSTWNNKIITWSNRFISWKLTWKKKKWNQIYLALLLFRMKYLHLVLADRLGGPSLTKSSVVRLTDCPDMTT